MSEPQTARSRVELLLDEGSFVELDRLVPHSATVTGHGTVDGRPVAVHAQDPSVPGGLGEGDGRKLAKVMDLALSTGCPVIGVYDAGGGAGGPVRPEALGVRGALLRRATMAAGVVPQISLVAGPCTGGAAYTAALGDFTVMVEGASHMVLAAPGVVRTVTGEEAGAQELGGAAAHGSVSGAAHHVAADEEEAAAYVRALLSYLPSNNLSEPPAFPEEAGLAVSDEDRELDTLVPEDAHEPYEMRAVLERVLDEGVFLETQELFAPNLMTGFGRVEGRPVGVVASRPSRAAGFLDIDASEKGARFVRTCDAFHLPVLTFVDVPGFLPGLGQEHAGAVRRGAKLGYAYAEATVPLLTVVLRHALGLAYEVMGSKQLGADLNLAWPSARIAALGAQEAVGVEHARALAQAPEAEREALRARLVARYTATRLTPDAAAARGDVDAVIEPSQTRVRLVRGLRQLRTKRESLPPKKHGNIPL